MRPPGARLWGWDRIVGYPLTPHGQPLDDVALEEQGDHDDRQRRRSTRSADLLKASPPLWGSPALLVQRVLARQVVWYTGLQHPRAFHNRGGL